MFVNNFFSLQNLRHQRETLGDDFTLILLVCGLGIT